MADFQSNFVFGLQGKRYQDFIDSVAEPIIKEILATDDYEIINFEHHLSHQDFANTKNSIASHIYNQFLNDIKKDKETGQFSFKKKVCISLDERLCNEICPITERKITTIKLAGVELAYFIYFDIKEFFNFVYTASSKEEKEKLNIHNNRSDNDVHIEKNNQYIENSSFELKDDIVSKLFSGNKIAKTSDNVECVERIGYVHNINQEKGFSFVHDSQDGNGFPIFYREFPEVENYPIGTAIKVLGRFEGDRFFVDKWEVVDVDELPFQLMKLDGTLKVYENSSFAIIRTNLGGVYTQLALIKEYKPGIIHQVQCVAVEEYNKKKGEMGWKAIAVYNQSLGGLN